jgi:hypothetical protein
MATVRAVTTMTVSAAGSCSSKRPNVTVRRSAPRIPQMLRMVFGRQEAVGRLLAACAEAWEAEVHVGPLSPLRSAHLHFGFGDQQSLVSRMSNLDDEERVALIITSSLSCCSGLAG